MKLSTFIIAVSITYLTSYLITYKGKPAVVITPPAPQKVLSERSLIKQQWMTDMRKVADKSGLPLAIKVIEFVEHNNILVEPIKGQNMKVLETSQGKNPFLLVVLSPGDERLGEPWSRMIDGSIKAAAFFHPENRAIILKRCDELSPLWRGVIALHEGHHAYTYLNQEYDWEDQRVYSTKERDTHSFENDLVSKLGGPRYEELLKSYSFELEERERELKKKDPRSIASMTRELVEFDEVFGAPMSQFERNLRNTHIWIQAYFMFIDRKFPREEADEKKALFLFSVYRASGILQAP